MPLDLGPVTFQIVGTFMDKPRLLINGEEVPYETMHAAYVPAETFEYKDYDGKDVKEDYPEHIALSFSLSSQIGQLEANVSYRVKANTKEQFVLEQVPEGDDVHAAKKPDFFKKKKDAPKEKKEVEKDGETEEKPKKKGKSMVIRAKVGLALDPLTITPDAGTRVFKKNVNRDILRNLVEDE